MHQENVCTRGPSNAWKVPTSCTVPVKFGRNTNFHGYKNVYATKCEEIPSDLINFNEM